MAQSALWGKRLDSLDLMISTTWIIGAAMAAAELGEAPGVNYNCRGMH